MSRNGKALILCVDDDNNALELFETCLAGEGYDVLKAANGAEALETIAERSPDLILLDVMLPDMDGYDVCLRFQETRGHARIPVIFTSALGEEEDRARGYAVGAVDYLVKPIDRDVLLDRIRMRLPTDNANGRAKRLHAPDLAQFKDWLRQRLGMTSDPRAQPHAGDVYAFCAEMGIDGNEAAKLTSTSCKSTGKP